MRTLAVGDVHGCSAALDAVLAAADPGPDDRVVLLGDYVDRGPDTRGVLDRLLRLAGDCKFTAIRGNHEAMMLAARSSPDELRLWQRVGGREALDSYAPPGRPGELADVPDAHWRFLETLLPWYETEAYVFVHAAVNPDRPMDRQRGEDLIWGTLTRSARPHVSGKLVVCGHTAQRSGKPFDLGHTVCIDTYAYGGGWLTCLELETGRYWQADCAGQVREGQRACPG